MASTYKVYKDDKAVRITLDLGTDLTTSTTRVFKVKKPDNSEVSWPSVGNATVVDTTKLQYTTVSGDLAASGTYIIQPYVEFGTDSVHRADIFRLIVKDPFTT